MQFQQSIVTLAGRELVCTNCHGRVLVSKVQALRRTVILPRAEVALACRVVAQNYTTVGLVKGRQWTLLLTTILNRPESRGQMTVRCINTTELPQKVREGTALGVYTGVKEDEIQGSEDQVVKIRTLKSHSCSPSAVPVKLVATTWEQDRFKG